MRRSRASDEAIRARFDAGVDCCAADWSKPTVRATHAMEDALRAHGVAGRSVLDMGCGEGRLSGGLLRAGAARTTGVDLSPVTIEAARSAASRAGFADRATFIAGNAATVPVAPHDVVVLNRLICCYGDLEGLLDHTIPAATETFAYSIPRMDGIWRIITPVSTFLENVLHRIKRMAFRTYAHDPRVVERRLAAAGFRRVHAKKMFVWLVAVYRRD